MKSARPFSAAGSRRIRPTSASSRAGRASRRREVLDPHGRRGGQQLSRARRLERLVGLEPHRLGVADRHRNAHAGRADGQLGQLEDLARLLAQLDLLVELLAVEVPVAREVVLGLRLVEQLLQPLGALARGRLVGRDAHRADADGVVERLQHERQRDRAAVRVRDDAVVLERPLAVHLGHDERHPVLQAEGLRLVDADRAAAYGVRHELAARAGADGEEAEVEVAGGEGLGCRLLDHAAVELAPGRARRGEESHVLEPALTQQLDDDGADRAGRADDADPRHAGARPPACRARRPGAARRRPCRPRRCARDRRS